MSEPKEFTVMIYLASDNPLAPGIVSQLKAIKDAGFHKQANVIVRFDPHPVDTPTHIFDVNLIEKLRSKDESKIGFTANDPFVRNLVQDKLWSKEKSPSDDSLIRDRLRKKYEELGLDYDPPQPTIDISSSALAAQNGKDLEPETDHEFEDSEPDPKSSLKGFLEFCAQNYPARHYILFILGHGIVVGNDIFLFDENSAKGNSLTLKELGQILRDFVDQDLDFGRLELVAFHSCSMSGLEVAYELRDTARYMIASQGPAFVGSFCYRQILIRIFNDIEKLENARDSQADQEEIVDKIVRRIFSYCVYNSYDFQLAGYSFDLCLTDLTKIASRHKNGVIATIQGLTKALIGGLEFEESGLQLKQAKVVSGLIVLSHWESQSYYEENFTDLFDFCFCLHQRCMAVEKYLLMREAGEENVIDQFSKMNTLHGYRSLTSVISDIKTACQNVMDAFPCDDGRRRSTPDGQSRNGGRTIKCDERHRRSPIVRTAFVGPAYQYSHGLSLYFPWTKPRDSRMWTVEYEKYDLSEDTEHCWKKFLQKYFDVTMRSTQAVEKTLRGDSVPVLDDDAKLLEQIGSLVFSEVGQLKDGPFDKTGKDTRVDPTGEICVCPSIKNYPPITNGIPTRGADFRDLFYMVEREE